MRLLRVAMAFGMRGIFGLYNYEIPAFAGIYWGSTGFDSEINKLVSTSCNDFETRKRLGQHFKRRR